jgi:hypothetical protein
MTAKVVGNKQPTPAPITPNASLTTGQKAALNALQTARTTFENSGVSVYIGEVNVLLDAIDSCLAAMV